MMPGGIGLGEPLMCLVESLLPGLDAGAECVGADDGDEVCLEAEVSFVLGGFDFAGGLFGGFAGLEGLGEDAVFLFEGVEDHGFWGLTVLAAA